MSTAPCLLIYHAALLGSPSRRGASLIVAFYAVSQEFYSFNFGFAYQTLALTSGFGRDLPAVLRPTCRLRRRRPAFLYFYCVAGADRHRVTDHTTSWMVLAFLIAWRR